MKMCPSESTAWCALFAIEHQNTCHAVELGQLTPRPDPIQIARIAAMSATNLMANIYQAMLRQVAEFGHDDPVAQAIGTILDVDPVDVVIPRPENPAPFGEGDQDR